MARGASRSNHGPSSRFSASTYRIASPAITHPFVKRSRSARAQKVSNTPEAAPLDTPDVAQFECCICMGDEVGMERVTLPCKHTFHTNCVLKWAAESVWVAKTSATCPCCRARITILDILDA